MSYIGNQPTQAAYLTDQFSGDGSTLAFSLSTSPANPASILVAVSGVLQDPTTYSISGNTLNFSGAPPVGTGNISVRYLGIPASGVTTTAYRTLTEFTATAGQTTFTPPSYTVGFISVFKNGVRLGAADYTATNGTTVVLANAASLNDLITTESFYVSSYLNAIPASPGAINLTSATYLSGILPVANGGTGNSGTAWTAYTPTVSCLSGTITSYTSSGQYQTIGKTCIVSMTITITNAGTGAAQLVATLPVTPAARIQCSAAGMECVNTGYMLKSYIPASSTSMQIMNYNNTTAIAGGSLIILTVVYETA